VEGQIGLKGEHNKKHGSHIKHLWFRSLPIRFIPLIFISRDLKQMSESYVLLEIGSQPYLTTFQDLDGRLAFSM
jgi:hypothetical protein